MKTWFHRLFLVLVLVCASGQANAITCLAAVAGGNWSAAGTWTNCGGGVPSSSDDADLTAVTGTITIDGTSGSPSLANNVTTGAAGTITHASSKELDVYGNLTLTAGVTYVPSAVTSTIMFKATATGKTITTAGKRLGNVSFIGVGGGWTLQDALDPINNTNCVITITSGVLTTGNNNVAPTNGCGLSATGTLARGLTLGTSTWKIFPNSAFGWDITDPTNMTLSAASSTITFANTTGSMTFASGGLTYGTVQQTTQTTGTLTTSGNFSATTLTFSEAASPGGSYQFGGNVTVSGTCTGNGNSVLNRVYWLSNTKGTARTISCGTSTFTNADFQDITGAGAATWSLAAITGGSGNCGNNSGITFTTPINAYHKTAVSDNWSAANWYTTSGGSTPISPQQFPLCQDTAIFDANSVTAGLKTITIDASAVRLPAMNWTGVLNTPALAFSTPASYFGSITFVSGMTVSGTAGPLTLEGRGSQTITTAGLVLTAPISMTAPGGTWTQQDAFTDNRASSTFSFTAGTWAAGANSFTLSGSSPILAISGAAFTTTAGVSMTGASSPVVNISSGSMTISGNNTLSISGTSAANLTVSGGDLNVASGIVSMTGTGSTTTFSGGTAEIGTLTRTGFPITIAGTAVQIGTGGAAYGSTGLSVTSGSIAPTTGNKITSVSSTAIAVSAASSGGGSCSFGDAGQWRDWNEANDNVRYRRAM